jgi:hypothetical protein
MIRWNIISQALEAQSDRVAAPSCGVGDEPLAATHLIHLLQALPDSWDGIPSHIKNPIQIDKKRLHTGFIAPHTIISKSLYIQCVSVFLEL